MDATLLLCDYAEAVNGKLYIAGAGWNQLAANQPAPVALGVIVQVPWDQTNRPHSIQFMLVDEDGQQVSAGEPPAEIKQGGKFEVGRPPGVTVGSPLPLVLAIRWVALPLPVGSYAFILSVDDDEVARASFRAV